MTRILATVAAMAALLAAALPARATEAPAVEFLNSGKVTPTTLPFSEAVRVGNTLYLSGQIGIKPGSFELVSGGIEGEARQTLALGARVEVECIAARH